jgi:hypothetical protein
MQRSESITEIAKALSAFQGEIKNPANTAYNPFFRSKYAPLPDILNLVRPNMAKHGLSIIQQPSGGGENISVTTILLHNSGEYIELDPLVLRVDKVTAQGIGSAITYGRRYALAALLGISSEDDDDGNIASGKNDNDGTSQPCAGKKQSPVSKTSPPAPKTDQAANQPKELDKGKVQRLAILRKQKGITDEKHKEFLKNAGVESSKYLNEEQYKKYADWLERQPDVPSPQ